MRLLPNVGMALTTIQRFYRREEFVLLNGPLSVPLFQTHLSGVVLSVPVANLELTSGGGLRIQWEGHPSPEDILAIDGGVASFVGGVTTSAPIVQANAGPVIASNSTAVDAIDFTTPALDGGTYQVIWTSSYRLSAAAANTAARAIATINSVSQQTHWGESVVCAYNGAATFVRNAGQVVRVQLQIAKIGAGVVNAEMTNARFSIDKIS
jgi:hypothetical protein